MNQDILPKDLSGLQNVVNGTVQVGDIWVSHGTPKSVVELGDPFVGANVDNVSCHGWNIYRRIPVPGHLDDKETVSFVNGLSEDKPTNPKDAIGSDKVPIHLWPTTATALGSMALLEGALKYGRTNYRAVGVRASIYYDALNRHMNAWFEGEDRDPESGLPHLAHALACVAILVDSQATGKLSDDRVFPGGYRKFMNDLTPEVKRLKDKYKDRNPKHYSIKDSNENV